MPIGVVGVGEGGLVALYCGGPRSADSIDVGQRIFRSARRNLARADLSQRLVAVDANSATRSSRSLVMPRTLVIEAAGPEIDGPPKPHVGPQRCRSRRDSHRASRGSETQNWLACRLIAAG